MLTTLTAQEWLQGVALMVGQIIVALAVLRLCFLAVRFGHRQKRHRL